MFSKLVAIGLFLGGSAVSAADSPYDFETVLCGGSMQWGVRGKKIFVEVSGPLVAQAVKHPLVYTIRFANKTESCQRRTDDHPYVFTCGAEITDLELRDKAGALLPKDVLGTFLYARIATGEQFGFRATENHYEFNYDIMVNTTSTDHVHVIDQCSGVKAKFP